MRPVWSFWAGLFLAVGLSLILWRLLFLVGSWLFDVLT